MIDVTHDGDDRRPRLGWNAELGRLLLLKVHLLLEGDDHRLDPEFLADLLGQLLGERLVRSDQDLLGDQVRHEVLDEDVQLLGQFPDRDGFRQVDRPRRLAAVAERNGGDAHLGRCLTPLTLGSVDPRPSRRDDLWRRYNGGLGLGADLRLLELGEQVANLVRIGRCFGLARGFAARRRRRGLLRGLLSCGLARRHDALADLVVGELAQLRLQRCLGAGWTGRSLGRLHDGDRRRSFLFRGRFDLD